MFYSNRENKYIDVFVWTSLCTLEDLIIDTYHIISVFSPFIKLYRFCILTQDDILNQYWHLNFIWQPIYIVSACIVFWYFLIFKSIFVTIPFRSAMRSSQFILKQISITLAVKELHFIKFKYEIQHTGKYIDKNTYKNK